MADRIKLALLTTTLLGGLIGGSGDIQAESGHRCGTPERLHEALANQKAREPGPIYAAGAKTTRDDAGTDFGSGYQVQTSDNFALKWKGTKPAQADHVLASLEESFSHYHDTLGHQLPVGADQYRVNVYAGNASSTPAIDFSGGYASLDDGGYAYIVVHDDIVSTVDSVEAVMAHEYYHSVEFGTNAYTGDSVSSWYWEAAAEWAVMDLWPEKTHGYDYVSSFMSTQHAPLFYFGDLFGEGNWALGTHQYGAAVFPLFVAQHYGGASVIVDSWKTAGQEKDPLQVLNRLIPDQDIGEVFAEFAAHNAYWDYPAPADQILQELSTWSQEGPADADGWNRIVATVPVEGTSDWVDIADNAKPGAFGYNLIEVSIPEHHEVTFEIEGESTGSMGNAATWGAVVARKTEDTPSYASAQVSDGIGSVQIVSQTGETKVFLAVSAVSGSREMEERFTYRYRVTVGDQADPDDDPTNPDDPDDPDALGATVIGGCSMSNDSQVPDASVVLLILMFAFLRRRERHRA